MSLSARQWLEKIRALPLPGKVKVMNVCGGHERSITMAGLRGALPQNVELIPGPGCPVCICPEEDVYEAIRIALEEEVTLLAYGDMLRVPVNVPKGEPRSLEQAKAAGADIRPIASPTEAVALDSRRPRRRRPPCSPRACPTTFCCCCPGVGPGRRSPCCSIPARLPSMR